MVGVWLGGKISKSDKNVQKYLGLGLFPQAGVAIGLALSLQHQSGFESVAPLVLNVIIATTIVHEFVGPLLTKYILKKSGDCAKNQLKDSTSYKILTKDSIKDFLHDIPNMRDFFDDKEMIGKSLDIFNLRN